AFCDFMAGQTAKFTRKLTAEMRAASEAEEYEKAARLRDDVKALERALEKQAVVLDDGTTAGLVEHFLGQFYGDLGSPESNGIPREVLVPELPPEAEAMTEWLSSRRGGPVALRVPQRGDKKTLAENVARNASQALALHKLRRASDLTTRSKALQEIQDALELDDAPLRIECYDVSNLQGTHIVASMVVFEDGLARKSEYRRFSIKGFDGTDDISAIREVITRRFRRYLAEREETGELDLLGDPEAEEDQDPDLDQIPLSERPVVTAKPKFAYPPNLVVVDGGAGQVAAAAAALAELGIGDVAVCGLAKRMEEVWLPDAEYPVILSRT